MKELRLDGTDWQTTDDVYDAFFRPTLSAILWRRTVSV
jgi:hypothetical protein